MTELLIDFYKIIDEFKLSEVYQNYNNSFELVIENLKTEIKEFSRLNVLYQELNLNFSFLSKNDKDYYIDCKDRVYNNNYMKNYLKLKNEVNQIFASFWNEICMNISNNISLETEFGLTIKKGGKCNGK